MSLIRTINAFHLREPLSSGAVKEHVPSTMALSNLFAIRRGNIDFIASVMGCCAWLFTYFERSWFGRTYCTFRGPNRSSERNKNCGARLDSLSQAGFIFESTMYNSDFFIAADGSGYLARVPYVKSQLVSLIKGGRTEFQA